MDPVLLLIVVGILLRSEPATGQAACSKPADIALLIDASGSIGRRRWPKVVEFTKRVVSSFNVSEEGSHVGIILYSTRTSVEVAFNTFQGSNLTAENINAKVDAISYRDWGGLTFIDRALILASEKLFTKEAGMRDSDDILKLLIVFTDGKQTKDKDPYMPLYKASRPLKEKGVAVYGLGIGSKKAIDVAELQQMASKPENVITAETFEELETLAAKIIRVSCAIEYRIEVED